MVKFFPHFQGLLSDTRLANRDNFLRLIALFVSLCMLVFIILATQSMLSYPYFGFNFYPEGLIYSVDPAFKFDSQITEGDYLVSIDGDYIRNDLSVYENREIGQNVNILVSRPGKIFEEELTLIELPIGEVKDRLLPILISFVFWISGLAVIYLKPRMIITWLFFLLTQFGCLVLVAGTLTAIGLYWANFPYYTAILVISVLSIHFHLHFPVTIGTTSGRRLLFAMYLGAFLGGYIALQEVFLSNSVKIFRYVGTIGGRLILLITFTVITFLLIYSYHSSRSPSKRPYVRIVMIGGLIGLVPLTFFSILPHLLVGKPIISYYYSIIPLAILPISYGYSIFKFQLIPKNVQIARPTVQVLTSTLTVAIYMVIMVFISRLVSPQALGEPVFLFLMMLILAALFTPTRSLIKQSLEKALIGGTFDLPWVISSSNKMVTESKSLSVLADQLQTILKKMHFSHAALMVPEKGLLTSLFHYGFSQTDLDLFNISIGGYLPGYLLEFSQPIWTNQLAHISSDPRLNDSELTFLSYNPPVIVVPLPARAELRGALILRPEFELDWSSDQDLFVLETLSNFLSVALDNAGFLDSVNVGAGEDPQATDESLHQKGGTSTGTEGEFQSIARELHDGPIQDLVGFGFELKKLQFPSIEQEGIYEHKLNSIIRELREICTNLRPASLYLGVTTAIQSLVLRFQENYPDIQFHLALIGETVEVGGEMSLALYRITQEAMNNVIQHAKAKNLWVSLEAHESQIQIIIRDDGNGFVIPESWFRFANEGHFGIMGMSERVQAIDGVFDISSLPGEGTCLRVVAPLTDS